MSIVSPIEELRSDHVKVRDALLALLAAVKERRVEDALEILVQLDKLTGPHFRFEEESLYPALRQFFGDRYIDGLIGAHDRVIAAAKRLAEVLGKGQLLEHEVEELAELIRRDVLPHPVECDGLGLFAERLPAEDLQRIAANLEASRNAGVPLLEWAATIRGRSATPTA